MSFDLMNITVNAAEDICLVRISGVLDQTAAGPIYDVLYDLIGKGGTRLIIDLSGVDLLTRAAARSLVVAAKLLQAPRGAMRVCGARSGVAAMLDGLGHGNLLKRDRDLGASLEALQPGLSRIGPLVGTALARDMPANANDEEEPDVGHYPSLVANAWRVSHQ